MSDPFRPARRGWSPVPGFAVILAWILAAAVRSPGQEPIRRVRIDMAHVDEIAARLAREPRRARPMKEAEAGALEALGALEREQHRSIQFLPQRAIWREEKLPFQLHMFHLGSDLIEPVYVNEFTRTHCQRVRFVQEFFDYSRSGFRGSLPSTLGYAGVRLLAPVNADDRFDEVLVFQGASYYRALGRGNAYGISGRGLALESGVEGVREEFPAFVEMWMGKPEPGDRSITMFALMDSESVAGAYRFVLTPGDPTLLEIDASLHFRKVPGVVGLSPFSSMFWFAENAREHFDDYRPEVHDSDGLAIRDAQGQCVWRPAQNRAGRIGVHRSRLGGLQGFGLLQRDRDPAHYQDYEARFHLRPSVWVEPTSDWGSGEVRMVELPTRDERAENLVAFWMPDRRPEPGVPYRYSYRQTWGLMPNPSLAGSYVVATREGLAPGGGAGRTIAVEFDGPSLRKLPSDRVPEADVTTAPDAPVSVGSVVVQRSPIDGAWRVSFVVRRGASKPGAPVPGSVELRCRLREGENVLSETWTYEMAL